MPSMRSPAQRAPGRQVEYATQDDVRVLAAEIRGLRESMEAELRAQRESVDARFEKVEAEIRSLREFMKAELNAQREFMKAELHAQRESAEARLEKIDGLLEGQQELIKVLLDGQVQHAARFDRQDARLDSLLKWGIAAMVAAMVGFGGLVLRLTGDG